MNFVWAGWFKEKQEWAGNSLDVKQNVVCVCVAEIMDDHTALTNALKEHLTTWGKHA